MLLHGFAGHITFISLQMDLAYLFPLVFLPPRLFTLPHIVTELTLVLPQNCTEFPSSFRCVHIVPWPGIHLPLFSLSLWCFHSFLGTVARAMVFGSESLRGLLLPPGRSCFPSTKPGAFKAVLWPGFSPPGHHSHCLSLCWAIFPQPYAQPKWCLPDLPTHNPEIQK